MSGWRSSHTVPDVGMWVWAAPDPAAAPFEQLAPGTPVEVVETTAGWSRIRCDNGFTGWVDARQLVPIAAALPPPVAAASPAPVALGPPPVAPSSGSLPPGPPPTLPTGSPPRRTPTLVAALVAAAAVAVIAIVAVGSGGDDDQPDAVGGVTGTTATATVTTTAPALVRLHLPAGWVQSADGLRAAETEADLAAPAPAGPVVRALVLDEPRTSDELLGFAGDVGGEGVVVEEPQSRDVDGFSAVSVVVRGADRVRVLVAVHPPGTAAVAFRIDAPAGRFDAQRSLLESIPGVSA